MLGFGVIGFALTLHPVIGRSNGVITSLVLATLIAIGAAFWAWMRAAGQGRSPHIEWQPKTAHALQAVAHLCVYAYWSVHHPPVQEQLWLIAAQIPFAYLIDMAAAWRKHDQYRLGFGPLPIIGSINLFLWMTDDWFYIQFLMVGLAYASREFLRWRKDEQTHIFNPSAFALVAVALVLLLTGQSDAARGQEIAATLGKGPFCYESILVAGLIVQALFPVVWTTLGAFVTVMAFTLGYQFITGGVYFIDTAIPVAVFLGMMLLITDPATSPRSARGRFIFGSLYGLSVVALYALLWSWSELPWSPDLTFYDKLLAVPVLNLMVPWINRMVPVGDDTDVPVSPLRRWGVILAWVVLYAIARPSLVDNPGRDVGFWKTACEMNPSQCDRLVISWQTRCTNGGLETSSACRETARRVLSDGCTDKRKITCTPLGQLLVANPTEVGDKSRGRALLISACHAGQIPMCTLLGEHLWNTKDPAKGLRRRILIRGCQSNDARACEVLGLSSFELAQTTDEFGFARDAFRDACRAKRPLSCANYAELLINGKGGRRKGMKGYLDQKTGRQVLRETCARGFQPACARMKSLPALPAPPTSQPSAHPAYPGMKLPDGIRPAPSSQPQ